MVMGDFSRKRSSVFEGEYALFATNRQLARLLSRGGQKRPGRNEVKRTDSAARTKGYQAA